ncbi:MAG TPA: protein kinase [Candidatus Methylomirabilis sp.]|nr:protein kinase [Candidatus Methylomirabilis sp.]
MIGQLLGHYRISSKIGEGGMGIVYRAHDEVLNRDVALKVLGQSLASDGSAEDFLLHEARASSALSHPNICTIHEVGEADGQLYIVMELVDGKPLNTLITKEGLPVESVLRYGTQIAVALAHSHSRGIIHRDLKSSNTVVTPTGLVKVLDFGLARRSESASLEGATESLSPVETAQGLTGTIQYMAPEILRGLEADHRIDIWALGVVLYEAASGQLPFKGRTAFEISSAILHELPPPLPSRIPTGLWAIIQRCLAKEPAQRYQQAGEVEAALAAVQSASIASTPTAPDQRGPLTTVHRGMQHLAIKNGDVLLLIGTTKGAFLLRSNAKRAHWDVAGPYFPGHAIYTLNYDDRQGRHRLWASTHNYWGTMLRSSEDYGKTWTNPQEANIKFPADCGASLKNIWQISLGRESEPDTMYCGVEPAALFESRDAGETWSLVRGLYNHAHRPRWMPGNGGLALHTILLDPEDINCMYVAISAGGVYRTADGGQTWEARNRGIRVVYAPEKYPEFGQCVHKIVMHPKRPERLFLQNHWGLYRSDDGAANWKDIAYGVPSDFGFAMVMHPHDADCVYIIPVESDEFRCTPEGALRVFRTRNAGVSWEALSRGLPQKGAYETILRDALTTDSFDPLGVFFGTRNGEIYGSADEGKSWRKIVTGLPSVVCVKCVVLGEPNAGSSPHASSSSGRKPWKSSAKSRRKSLRPARRR